MAIMGNLSLWLALLVSVYAAIAFALSARGQSRGLLNSARGGLVAVAGLVTVSVFVLLYAIVTHNFQFEYVASYTGLNTSPLYLLSALWEGNSGSLLFWAWVLSVLSLIVVLRKWNKFPDLIPFAAMVLMLTQAFFLILLITKLSPFTQSSPVPSDGSGMNPLLLNIGMVFHPPALLAGYAIFAIPFAFAISALLVRNSSDDWLSATRKYMLLAWLLLGAGNIIGAWWAYYDLSFHGYWSWDPVENAGLMPWLMATAFLHSSVMQRRRGSFKIWSLVLIILTFCLVIFATFLSRTSILNSVHNFQDTGLTPFFMIFIGIALFGSLFLLYYRYEDFRGESANQSLLSREGTFILNNIFLVGTTFIILVGTIFPLLSEALVGTDVALNTSFFDTVNGPLFMAIIILVGICTLIGWRQVTLKYVTRKFLWPLVVAIILGVILGLTVITNVPADIAITVCLVIILAISSEWIREAAARHRGAGQNYFSAWWSLLWSNGQRYGGYTVHIGIILMAIGVIGSHFYGVQKEANLKVGESLTINQYTLTYQGFSVKNEGDNTDVGAKISVYSHGNLIDNLTPRKTFFPSWNEWVPAVSIRSNLSEDLYISLENNFTSATSWQNSPDAVLNVTVNPLVNWIWIGGIVVLVGGLVTFWPGRRSLISSPDALLVEETTPPSSAGAVPAPKVSVTDDEIENLILSKRQQTGKAEDETEKLISEKRKNSGSVCAKCGTKNKPNARFCSQCGANLSRGKRNG